MHIIRNARIEYVGKSESCMVVGAGEALRKAMSQLPEKVRVQIIRNARV